MKRLRHYRPYLVALGLLWVVPAMLVWYLTRTLPPRDAQCQGPMFSCMSPADTVLFYALYATPVLALLGLVACAVIILVRRRRTRTDRRALKARTTT